MIHAEVLADSINLVTGSRLTTFRLTYPRAIHPELMTHRMLARCVASSRAIPAKRMRANIRSDMFIPLDWGQNQGGMQAGKPISDRRRRIGTALWILMGHLALLASAALDRLGVHKQIVNRITEPWSHTIAIFTGTDRGWAQFYDLRRHPMAEPHIHALADVMAEVHRKSIPKKLKPGEWHIPLLDQEDLKDTLDAQLQHSVARVARTSYSKPDTGTPSGYREDVDLHNRLLTNRPMHASPAEHQAQCTGGGFPGLAGCFGPESGWVQYRKIKVGEMTGRTLEETLQ